MCFNGLRGNSEVSAQKAKNTVCFVGYIVNVLSGVSRGVSGCPETPPPAMIFLNQGGDTVTGTDPHQPLTFATFGNPP